MSKTGSALAAEIASLTDAERAALPSRLRALNADDRTKAWGAAKAERDAALAAAWAKDDETGAYLIPDPDERAAAVAAAKEAWAATKADLLAEG